VGKPEGKRILGRPRHRWEGKIEMGFREIGWGRIDWIHLADSSEPSGSIKYWDILEWLSDWRLLMED
jgi:hypothetical protein